MAGGGGEVLARRATLSTRHLPNESRDKRDSKRQASGFPSWSNYCPSWTRLSGKCPANVIRPETGTGTPGPAGTGAGRGNEIIWDILCGVGRRDVIIVV